MVTTTGATAGGATTTTGKPPPKPPYDNLGDAVKDLVGLLVESLRYIGACRLGNILATILQGVAALLNALGCAVGRGLNCRKECGEQCSGACRDRPSEEADRRAETTGDRDRNAPRR
ncbi:hypothetical protein FHR84_003266 [Actinopolyspora biskrensis]|uniref:Uncharacterized protein n=1 Tax=Actinopolyspora biskrensis TaxID=1470178 RepID=A0A852ZBC3_9ACTN|nr:hypothetical protein [Actinopolyspora biskrensis]NYH79917.1 hypothetical protein [Actinopolyspora biskrensis]